MAFPYIFHANFEAGDNSEFDSEADTDGILDFPHYSALSNIPFPGHVPYSGAYCMRIAPAGGTNSATLTEADINIADTDTGHFAFNVLFAQNFDATADDTFPLLELHGSGSEVVVALGARYVAATDVINIGAGSAVVSAVPSTFASLNMKRDVWYTIEMSANIETNASGTIDVFITEAGQTAQATADIALSSQDHIAVTDGIFGLQDHLATTTGTILLDNFVMDDARVYPFARYPVVEIFTKSAHAFIGPGHVASAALLTNEGSNIMRLWDTDTADTNSSQCYLVEFDIDGNHTAFGGPLKFEKGCYVELSGTNPRGSVTMIQNSPFPGVFGPFAYTDAMVRRQGQVG